MNQYPSQAKYIWFDSIGGSQYEGLTIGRAIRAAGGYTVVGNGNSCNSACAYAFMGGVERFLAIAVGGRKRGVVAVHAMMYPDYDNAKREDLEDIYASAMWLTGKMIEYAEDMNISREFLMVTFLTPASEFYVVDHAFACRNGITLWDFNKGQGVNC